MKQLTIIEKMTPAEIFVPETIDSILAKIREEASSISPDLTTSSGRKEIASIAYKIAQSKTFMDECGKKLGEEAKKKLDSINAERKKIRDTLDTLKEEVRKPLTEWENGEQKRIDEHEAQLGWVALKANDLSLSWQTFDVEEVKLELAVINEKLNRDWEEFKDRADNLIPQAIEKIEIALSRRHAYELQQEELKRLREEKFQREKLEAERLEKEREEARIKAEAEAKARAEDEREARLKREAELKAEHERQLIAREKQLAEEKRLAIAKEKSEAEFRAREAAERAEREKQLAIENERKRLEQEKLAKEAADKKREENKKHVAKVNNEIVKSLMQLNLSEESAKSVVRAIFLGEVPHVKINY